MKSYELGERVIIGKVTFKKISEGWDGELWRSAGGIELKVANAQDIKDMGGKVLPKGRRASNACLEMP